MARKKKEADTQKDQGLDIAKVRSIWTAIPIDSWMDFLQQHRPGHNWVKKGREIWGKCVYHTDPTASFHVRLEQGYAKCFGQCNTFEGDPIAFAAKILGRTYTDAFNYLYTKYGFPGFSSDALKEIQAHAYRQELKKHIFHICNLELAEAAYTKRNDPLFAYTKDCVDWLEQRNIPLGDIHRLPLGIVPTPERLWARIQELEKATKTKWATDIQEYMLDAVPKSRVEPTPYAGYLLFPNFTAPNQIGLFRYRKPPSLNPSDTSVGKGILVLQEKRTKGLADSEMGFFGLGASIYQTVIGNTSIDASKTVVVVEGEFDVLAPLVQQAADGDPKVVVVGACGNNNHNLTPLRESGFEQIYIVGDRDNGGENFVKQHLRSTKAVATKVFQWPSHFTAVKDLHDVFMTYGGKAVVDAVANEANYVLPQQWALELFKQEDAQEDKEDVRKRARLAVELGQYITDDIERNAYHEQAADIIGIPASKIKSQVPSTNTEEGFVALLAGELLKTYKPLFVEDHNGARHAFVWNRASGRTVMWDTSKGTSLMSQFKGDLGPLWQWVANTVGEPAWLQDTVDEDGNIVTKGIDKKEEDYKRKIVDHVVPLLVKGLPPKSTLATIKQGIHVKNIQSVNGVVTGGTIYAINGQAFCKGEINPDGTTTWSEVDGPVDGNYLITGFEKAPAWSTAFTCAEDIINTPPVDIKHTYNKLKEVFNSGWRFKAHDLEIQYLAAFVLTTNFMDLCKPMPWVIFNAPAQSGKSSLVVGLLSGTNRDRRFNLLENSVSADNFTSAGVVQGQSDAAQALILDEFELAQEGASNDKKQKGNNCQLVLNILRSAYSDGSRIIRGTSGGESTEANIRFPVVLSGINPLTDRADITRFNTINLQHLEKGPDGGGQQVSDVLLKKFPQELFIELRHAITMYALQNPVLFTKTYHDVKAEFANAQHFSAKADSRFQGALMSILTIMKLAGEDYTKFATEYSNAKMELLEEKYFVREYDELWHSALFTPSITLQNEEYRGKTFTLAQVIQNQDMRPLLLDINCGVYYIPDKDYLLVMWSTATTGTTGIFKHTKFASRTASALKDLASTDDRVLAHPGEDESVAAFLRQLGMRNTANITVIPATYFLNPRSETALASVKNKLVDQASVDEKARTNPAAPGEAHNI